MTSARDLLLAIWFKCGKDRQKVYGFLRDKEEIAPDEVEEILKDVDKDEYVTIVDVDYPAALTYRAVPPLVIKRRKAK